MSEGEPVRAARVLLVDDDVGFLRAYGRLLRGAGYAVEATDAVFAVPALVRSFDPDIVLLDVNMPTAPGDRLVRSVRAALPRPDSAIVFCSNEDEAALADLVRRAQVTGYVSKSVTNAEFLAALEELTGVPPDLLDLEIATRRIRELEQQMDDIRRELSRLMSMIATAPEERIAARGERTGPRRTLPQFSIFPPDSEPPGPAL